MTRASPTCRFVLRAALALCAAATRAHGELAPLPGAEGFSPIGRQVEVLEDRGGHMTLADVLRAESDARFTRNDTWAPNFGYTRSAYWLRFRLPAGAPSRDGLLLEIRFPSIDRLDFYHPEGDGWRHVRAGDTLPWDAREVKHRNHVFRIPPPATPGPRDYYLRVASGSVLTVPMFLWEPQAFARHDNRVQYRLGAFYGFLGALLLYNLMLFFTVRDRAYLYYVAYVLAFAVYLFTFDGLAFQYWWPESVWWANHALATALALTLAFGALFSATFLDMARNAPRANRGMLAIVAAGALLALAAATGWVLDYGEILRALSLLGPLAAAVALWVAVRAMLRGERAARFFLLAWGALLVFIALGALRNFALVPTTFATVHGLHIGVALDVALLSFALADRINELKRERAAAQAEALANHGALLEATRASERALERGIAERTAELNRANERLREEARERDLLMEQLKEQEQHLRFMAQHDALTGLPNRLSMQQRLALAMELAKRNRKKLAVMLVDLNDFKRLNDSRGHLAGDHALAAIAARLRTSVRGSDTVARFGGDEFVVLAGELDRPEDAGMIAEKIADMVGAPLPVDGGTERVGCSIGIAVYPDDADSAEALLERADRAMYAVKSASERRYAFYAA
jgi:diguanylate cyclase (GGDEF)-like protein